MALEQHSNLPIPALRARVLLPAFYAVLCILLASQSHAALQLPASPDVRILIDISGSMKKNDPENLRIPALNLITELLPDSSHAGVWTFGQYVNMLVPYGPVDDAWRKDAKEKSRLINSVALYTNIGAALERSAEDAAARRTTGMSAQPTGSNPQIILLTDGVVDISKSPGANVVERNRILTGLLREFKAAGATIHTVALSPNADTLLLEQLSVQTRGMYSLAETSEELSRVFLRAFDSVVQGEEVPLEGNGFDLDSTVEEFTALVFKAPGAEPLAVVSPAGERITAESRPESVRWVSARNYDLITIDQPVEGSWQLVGELAVGSRVTVVSNLRLIMNDLPVQFFAGDELNLKVGFFENGEPITNPDLLRLIDVSVTIASEGGKSGTKAISDPAAPPADGIFATPIRNLQKAGRYSVLINADGKTFKRQTRRIMELSEPMAVEVEAVGSGDSTQWRIHVTALSPNIDVSATSIVAKTRTPDGGTLITSMPFVEADNRWTLDIEPSRGDGIYEVSLRVKGRTTAMSAFDFDPELVLAEFPRQTASPNEFKSLVGAGQLSQVNESLADDERERVTAAEQEQLAAGASTPPEMNRQTAPVDSSAENAEENQIAAPEDGQTEKNATTQLDPILLWAAIGGGVLLLLLGGVAFFLIRRKRSSEDGGVSKAAVADGTPDSDDDLTEAEEASLDAGRSPLAKETEQADEDDFDIEADLFGGNEAAAPVEQPEVPAVSSGKPSAADFEDDFGGEAGEDPGDDLGAPADELRDIPSEAAAEPASEDDGDPDDLEFSLETGEDEAEPAAEIDTVTSESQEETPDLDDIDDLLDQGRAVGTTEVEDNDDEFNLEDFDIADTDELPEKK